MGSGLSKKVEKLSPTYGSIELNTQKTCYHAGETVSGEIYLNLLESFYQAQLLLKFEGYEAVYNIVTVFKNRRMRFTRLKNTKRTLHKQKGCLYSWEKLSSGQYVIPFTFTLPPIIPASFFHEDKKHEFSSYIRHKLNVCLKSNVKSGPVLRKQMNFIIRERPLKPLSNVFVEEIRPLISCCCIPRGLSVIRAYFEKNTYKPGEVAKVRVEFDNSKSSIKNLSIEFMLRQKVRLLGGLSLEYKFPILGEHFLDGVKAKSQTVTYSMSFQIPKFRGDDHDLDKRNNHDPGYAFRGIGATTRSTLVSSEYFLQVICPMDACCLTLLPEAACPVQIELPDPKPRELHLPLEWYPETLAKVNVSYGFAKLLKMKAKDISKGMVNPEMP